MAVCPIRIFPDPVLAQPCSPILDAGRTLLKLVQDLRETLLASPGVGLAAPQIGVLQRISVIDVGLAKKKISSSNNGFMILINPRLTRGLGEQIPREGCLSVPDLLANVRRFETVFVETQLLEGGTKIFRAEGFEALAVQHELDHLDGKLFLDRVTNLKTDIFRRK
jgi:peptide deformylase